MTKSELTQRLSRRCPQRPAREVEHIARKILEAMAQALLKGGRIEIRGFGSIGLNYRPPRLAHNPRSGAKIPIPPKYVPHFRPGKDLRERVQPFASNERDSLNRLAA